jgi:hypothetical protein
LQAQAGQLVSGAEAMVEIRGRLNSRAKNIDEICAFNVKDGCFRQAA